MKVGDVGRSCTLCRSTAARDVVRLCASLVGVPGDSGQNSEETMLRACFRRAASSFSLSLSEALQWEAAAQTVNFASKDTREGVAAFIEKRAPVFRGR